jgi:hypothetical protein
MKKLSYIIALAGILFTMSCSKTKTNTSNPGGTWTFKSTTYNTISCSRIAGFGESLTDSAAVAGSKTPTAALRFTFDNNYYPTADGSYVVSGLFTNDPGAVTVEVHTPSGDYASRGDNPIKLATVKVSNGKVSISGSSILMENLNNLSDTTRLTFNVDQLE